MSSTNVPMDCGDKPALTRSMACETNHIICKLNYNWSINRFSLYTKDGYSATKYFSIDSPKFGIPEKGLQFFLKIYPSGFNSENENCVSCFLVLHRKSDQRKPNVHFKFSIKKTDGSVYRNCVSFINFSAASNSGRGWPNFISHKELFDSTKALLSNDKLTIYFEADIITGTKSSCIPAIHDNNLENIAKKNIDNHLENLLNLHLNPKFSDVVIVIGRKHFPAQKAILAARSSVFAAMFEPGTFKESLENKVVIKDIDAKTFEIFLKYIYTGKVDAKSLELYAEELLEAADKYDMGNLKEWCEEYLASHLTINSAVSTLIFADLHNAQLLKAKTMQFLVKNSSSLLKIENWSRDFKTRHELYTELISNIIRSQNGPI